MERVATSNIFGMSESKKINIDPITMGDVMTQFYDNYESAKQELVEEYGDSFEYMYWEDVAELFCLNGFLLGCMAMTENEELKESISLMLEEIEYQKKKK